jgi:hypothetical protein
MSTGSFSPSRAWTVSAWAQASADLLATGSRELTTAVTSSARGWRARSDFLATG